MIVKDHPPVVFAVGYSVRALVEACWLSGIECVAVDHFADADTRQFANQRWIEFQLSERGLLHNETATVIQSTVAALARSGKKPVFLLAGGMENLGEAVEQLREIAPVLGPTEEQRLTLRNIQFLGDLAEVAGLQTPKFHLDQPDDDDWLWKPFSSAGGLKIVRSKFNGSDDESGYWQEYIRGEQIGVSCLVSPSRYQFLGATSSWDAKEWAGPLEFIYRGSMGPIALSTECQLRIQELCHNIRDRIEYCGWLQFDFIRDVRGKLWLLECNPRWTAGMEISLFSGDVNPLRDHLAVHGLHGAHRTTAKPFKCFAKAIVYATETINLTDNLIEKLNQIEGLSDRPHAPQVIERGHPIATVRCGLTTTQASEHDLENRTMLLKALRKQAQQIGDLLNPDYS